MSKLELSFWSSDFFITSSRPQAAWKRPRRRRQRDEIARQRRHEDTRIPEGFDYAAVRGLSAEARQKLERVRPQTVGQAQRIPGLTPAAVSLLLVHLARKRANAA